MPSHRARGRSGCVPLRLPAGALFRAARRVRSDDARRPSRRARRLRGAELLVRILRANGARLVTMSGRGATRRVCLGVHRAPPRGRGHRRRARCRVGPVAGSAWATLVAHGAGERRTVGLVLTGTGRRCCMPLRTGRGIVTGPLTKDLPCKNGQRCAGQSCFAVVQLSSRACWAFSVAETRRRHPPYTAIRLWRASRLQVPMFILRQ